MAPSVLGIGLPSTSDIVPWFARGSLQKSLNVMEADMKASIYDWEMLYITPDQSFDLCTEMLRKKKWDIVMVGMGLRKFDSMIPFFERVVNAVHKELPDAKFAFNTSIEKTRDAVDRVAASKE